MLKGRSRYVYDVHCVCIRSCVCVCKRKYMVFLPGQRLVFVHPGSVVFVLLLHLVKVFIQLHIRLHLSIKAAEQTSKTRYPPALRATWIFSFQHANVPFHQRWLKTRRWRHQSQQQIKTVPNKLQSYYWSQGLEWFGWGAKPLEISSGERSF